MFSLWIFIKFFYFYFSPKIIQDERCAGGSRRPRGGARSSLSQSSGVESVASLGGRSKSVGRFVASLLKVVSVIIEFFLYRFAANIDVLFVVVSR